MEIPADDFERSMLQNDDILVLRVDDLFRHSAGHAHVQWTETWNASSLLVVKLLELR